MSKRLDNLARSIELAQRATKTLPDAIPRLMAARPSALAAASYDGPNVTNGSASSSPTERLTGARDPSARDRIRLDDALRAFHAAAVELVSIGETWAPHQPSKKALTETEAANVVECQCHRAAGLHEDADRLNTDCKGNLTKPTDLCEYCYRFVLKVARVPHRSELVRVKNGQRIRLSADELQRNIERASG